MLKQERKAERRQCYKEQGRKEGEKEDGRWGKQEERSPFVGDSQGATSLIIPNSPGYVRCL